MRLSNKLPHSYQNYMAKPGHSITFFFLCLFWAGASIAYGQTADLPNFHAVNPYLLRGGEPSIHGLKMLKDMGVESIVDLRAPTPQALAEKAQCEKLGIKYENLPMSSKPPTEKQVETFLSMVTKQEKISKDSKQPHPLFVHCAHGSDRTGCMVGIFRVTHDHWSYPKTYLEMRKYYFGPQYRELAQAVKERVPSSPK
jgi:protein tyrosine/serine phosphatase